MAATSSAPWPHRRTFAVAYRDLDVLRHLNHAVYFPWMETLRCEYYLSLLGSARPEDLDIIVLEAACRYLAPAGYGDTIVGEIAPARPLGRTSFTLLYRFTSPDAARLYARGRTVIVTYDYDRNEKKAIPGAVRSRLEADGVDPVGEGWPESMGPPVVSSGKRGVGGY